MSIKAATETVKGIGKASKMPWITYGLPARECKTGSKLREIAGTPCSDCYAHTGSYIWKSTQDAQYRRLETVGTDEWVAAWIEILNGKAPRYIRKTGEEYAPMRWHDSGDIQSIEHLHAIVEIARATPLVRHWLPTQEHGIVSRFLRIFGEFPANLIVRLSAPKVDGKQPTKATGYGSRVVTVATDATCPATLPGNHGERATCNFHDTCRKCWEVPETEYFKH